MICSYKGSWRESRFCDSRCPLAHRNTGMGASLQHYNPLIDDEVRKAWNLPGDWKLVAQMPFGVPVAQPGSKEVMSLDERVFEFTD